ncbi:NTP transferase domain-containing protein [Paenibacillus sp. NPDC057967]|uniref:phosphocholine cytidylyltransferase family protein n=1 Tax=Paenibacillus sp. NPDC057967 TaxID=3346293 RepID=UPI0036DB9332
MRAIILAAGRGNRMNEGTAEIPKCMMQLFGITILEHCIRSLESAGFTRADIGIVTGYKKEKIRIEGVRYFHNPNWESTNMFVSLTMAEEWLRSEPIVVCYSDILFHPSAVKKLIETDGDVAITYYTGFWELWSKRFANPFDDLETFKMVDGKLIEIGGRANSKEDIQGQYMGLLRFTPSGWENVENAIKNDMTIPLERLDMTMLLQHMLTLGYEVGTISTDELWLECDNQNDIRLYEKEFGGYLTDNINDKAPE